MKMKTNVTELKKKANWVRNQVLEMAVKAGAGHIAPSFSCADILVALYYGGILRVNPRDPDWKDRDRFILSKGQSAIALYAVLADLGFFPVSELSTFTQQGSRLGGHLENDILGSEAFTGSLGHGLSIGCGLTLGANMDKRDYLTVVLLGDGECHEGSIWEAAMFAGYQKLNRLIAIVDQNGLSATNFLDEYLSLSPFEDKWKSFGWDVRICDGHSFKDMLSVFKDVRSRKSNRPLAVIAKTTKGKGVSFMENVPIWHYRIPVGEELEVARKELKFS